jgi:anti-anti-sigma factor
VGVAELRLSSESRGESLIVSAGGELDIVTSRRLDDLLTRSRRQHRRIVLDLAAVDFMDTSSLAVIVGHWKRLQAAGGELVLAGARYRYTKTLWITGLAERLTMYDSVEPARPVPVSLARGQRTWTATRQASSSVFDEVSATTWSA